MSQGNKPRIHILQIVGSQVGGIRKHIHSILLNLDAGDFKFSYAYSTVTCDAKFHADLETMVSRREIGLLPLVINRQPSPLDVVNLLKIGRYLAQSDVDILHGHGAKGGLYARILGGLFGLKTIYTPHGGTAHNMFSRLGNALYTAIEKALFSWTDYFLFESLYTANAYQAKVKRIPQHWRINHNGVTEVAARPCLLAKDADNIVTPIVKIGVFGMLRREKGQIYAAQALTYVLAQQYEVVLHLFGDGPTRDKLVEAVDALQIRDRVIFHGDVSDAEAHMRMMDIILIPSLYESFGYVAAEAMALAKPIIATRVGGLCEVLQDGVTAILVEAGNPQDIAAAIITYLTEPQRAREYSTAGYERFQAMFTEDRMCRVIADTYHRVIDESSLKT